MSTYLNFFIRKNDVYTEVLSYSKSTLIYDLFREYSPYTKVKKITEPILIAISSDITNGLFDLKEQKAYYQKRINDINAMTGSIKEKIEAIDEVMQGVIEVDELEVDYRKAEGLISVLFNLRDTLQYTGDGNVLESDGIYAGVEVENPITIET